MPDSRIQEIFKAQSEHRPIARKSSAAYRLGKLKAIKSLILKEKTAIANAMEKDFRKPRVESDLTEIMPVVSMLNMLEKKLASWMKDEKVGSPPLFAGTKSWIRREAKGNCLIISPWNYPFQLAAYPVLTAFAAGNTCMVKPSEFTPETNKVLIDLFSRVFNQKEAAFFEGESDVSQALLKLPFDHIFFTGSTRVGGLVAEAAAKHLASATLELGGKSPCVVDGSLDLREFAARIAWGKLVNAGQTCVAPDYVLIQKEYVEKLCRALKASVEKFYPGGNFAASDDYSQIITSRHGERLKKMLEQAQEGGAEVVFGGRYHGGQRVMEPAIVVNPPEDCDLMNEEIFGPVLPVIGLANKEEMADFINKRDNPLALYVCSGDDKFLDYFLDSTCSGGATLNDTLINVGHPALPFGGAGKSGLGRYHGKHGFDEFSRLRAVSKRTRGMGADYFYPPYTKTKTSLVDWLLRKFSRLF